MNEKVIHIQWQGPLSFHQAVACTDRKQDYGIYQVCGPHVSYGRDVLLYIGKAASQTFGKRLLQEGWVGWQKNRGSVTVYLGKLHGGTTPSSAVWGQEIDLAERLLILSHRPAHNSKGLYRNSKSEMQCAHLFNWGDRGDLLPEVSGARWSSRFDVVPGYAPYSNHGVVNLMPESSTEPISVLGDEAAEPPL